ncbi:MAG TPA: sigma-54 dependent transcriptional regulator [Candidatus Baltobacteraceae bacterium]|nr:sigma-54 dependent transcriptional regulator [Candidatus Baltobacteraceae bacterium]
MNGGQILVVDDEASQREILRAILSAEGYSVETAATAAEALEHGGRQHYEVILTDLRMPGADGLSLVRSLSREDPPTLVIIMTGHGSLDSAGQAMQLGAFDYLTKPLERDDLLRIVGRAFDRIRLLQENRLLREQLEQRYRVSGIVGNHYRMREVFDKLHKVSNTNSTVLITGESGTGKELIARAIHEHSARRDQTFVAVSCAAIPETLIESELFGHEKGAFTGAFGRQIGLFEAADKSTLFLDEIGELSVGMQAKVLRALQEREIRRVGSRQSMKVDPRIIAATNKNLEDEVGRGRFREDLFYRLNVVTINLPPLRERSTDIPQLAEHFVKRTCVEAGRPALPITDSAMRLLHRYHWPGNVRQLQAVLERAALLSDGQKIDDTDLPIEVRFSTLPSREPDLIVANGMRRFLLPPEGMDLEAVERDFLVQAMEMSGWVIAKAAKLLGLSYRTLQYRLEKFQIHREGGDGTASDRPPGDPGPHEAS